MYHRVAGTLRLPGVVPVKRVSLSLSFLHLEMVYSAQENVLLIHDMIVVQYREQPEETECEY